MGRVATILFAHKLGTSLEPECKMYRLAADIFNDSAMVLDCLSPALPKMPRVVLLGFSSVLRALCGVAAGSSKASLSAHFAKWGNLGELNAVGDSQILHHTTISALPPWSVATFENHEPPSESSVSVPLHKVSSGDHPATDSLVVRLCRRLCGYRW